jgi:hypothetical protein
MNSTLVAAMALATTMSVGSAGRADAELHQPFTPIRVCAQCATLPFGINDLPFGINDRSDVTGLFFDSIGRGRGFVRTGGHLIVVDIPGAHLVEAQRANNGGDVLGDYVAADGIGRPWVRHADGTLDTKPGFPNATFTGAIFITESGRIMGYATHDPAQAAGYFGYFLDGTTYSAPFSYPGANVVSTYPVSMNHRGEMVGSVQFDTIQNEHGFYRSPSGQFRLVDYPGSRQSEVFDITDDGLMLGRYEDADGVNHGFFLRDGQFTTLDYFGPQTYIWKINARGEVAGYSFERNAYGAPAEGFVYQYHR